MTTVLSTIFVLGVLVFVHELGHFLVAKRVGIRVERFSLGFPPKMIGTTIGETEYCISWLPLGGYVKMAGENPDEGEPTGDPREFMSKSIGARAMVILAGPVMNFILAIVVFSAVFFCYGRPVVDPDHVVVGPVIKQTPAEAVGIKPGDFILAIDHKEVHQFDEMAHLVHARPGDTVEVLWSRDGELFSARVRTLVDTIQTPAGTDTVVGMLGVRMGFGYERLGLLASISAGAAQTISVCRAMVDFLGGLFSGAVSIKMVSGPVGIARFAGEAAREGMNMLLNFMAVLSVNLAILNVLPVPVLDGGHLVFLFFEKLRGRPLTVRQRSIAQQVGLGLLLLLIVTVTYHDVLRLFGG
ncbi:MAG: RIP metalloprotease RseP [candidate division Zixibacteria bacterium]|nr:RIP metalloprotease RseP [candidate division Zixibacteria bacterium]